MNTQKQSTHTMVLVAVLAVFIAGCATIGPSLRHAVAKTRAARIVDHDETGIRERNESAFAQILGEARTSVADLMFVKTNRYMHAGVGFAPRLNLNAGDDSRMFSSCTSDTPTLIRKKYVDFRWILGDLERNVKPFNEASAEHVHERGDEMAPWYRVITLVNPNYIRAYRIGAKVLADEYQWQQALDFLQEGIKNNQKNPELFLLYQSLGSFHMKGRFQKSYPWGNAWSENALLAVKDAYAFGKKQRPPYGEIGKIHRDILWTDDYEEDFRYCAHMIPLLLREQGKLEEALQWAKNSYADCPKFSPLKRLIDVLSASIQSEMKIYRGSGES